MTDTNTGTKKVVINGTTFWIDRIMPEQAAVIFFDLQTRYLPIVSDVFDVVGILKTGKGDKDETMMAAMRQGREVVAKISTRLTGAEFKTLCDTLFVDGTISFAKGDNQPIKLADATRGMAFTHWFDMIELIVEVFKWNFTDFLPRLATLFGDLKGKALGTKNPLN